MDDIASIVTQQGELARRRKLLEAMQGQNMGAQIQGGGRGNAIGQALAKVATAYMLSQGGEKLAGEETANREQYQGALHNELGQYLDRRDGSGQMYLPGVPSVNQGTSNQTAAVPASVMPAFKPANPREAIVRAMTSQLPEMQAVGRADFAGLAKQQINPMDLLKLEGYDPKSKVVAALSGDPSKLAGKREFKDANGQIFTIGEDGKPVLAVDARDKYGPTTTVNGEAVQFVEGTGKAHQVANRPAQSRTDVKIVPPAQKAGLEELAKQYAKNVSDMGEQARQAQRLSGALAQMGKLSDSGTFEGPLADPAIWVNRLAASAGIPVDKNKLSNSETYGSVASEAVQRLVGQFGGNRGVTKEEAAVIAQIIPQLQASPQARAQMTQILQGMAERQMQAYKAAHQNYVKFVQTQDADQIDPTLYGSQMPIESPVPAQPGAGQRKPTVTNW